MSGFFKDIEREGRRIDRQLGLRPPRIDTRLPETEPEAEPVEVIEEEAGAARRRQRRKLSRGGPRQTVLGGIQSALKKRLGA